MIVLAAFDEMFPNQSLLFPFGNDYDLTQFGFADSQDSLGGGFEI
jgi:hypothetical protein